MNKRILHIFCIFCFIGFFCFLTACNKQPNTIELIFHSNGGDLVTSIEITQGKPFSLPVEPTKTGYTFSGWYVDNETFSKHFTVSFDLKTVEDTKLDLYAKWIPIVYTLSFQSNGGSSVDPINRTVEMSSIIKPIDPTKDGYTFIGWYKDQSLTLLYSFDVPINENATLYAKWEEVIMTYTLSFETNGGNTIASKTFTEGETIVLGSDPIREGFIFEGWYLNLGLTEAFTMSEMPDYNITLYAKWTEENTNQKLATEVIPYFSPLYGNTNGNLNNLGLAVYDNKRALHYFSVSSVVYQYNPATGETSSLFSLTSGGRATYLNLDIDKLYFIDSNGGHLSSYDLVNHTFKSVLDKETLYTSRTQTWVNVLYPTTAYEQVSIAFQRYYPNTDTFSSNQGYGYEQMNIHGTRVYYKPIDSLSVNVMSNNGSGKSTIINLTTLNVTKQYETLLYRVNNDYVAYLALILDKSQAKGLYLYNSIDGLVEIIQSSQSIHSLNYDGIHLYVISNNQLLRINTTTYETTVLKTLATNDSYLNIINHWIYIGSYGDSSLYRINPVTGDIESVISE